MEGLNLSLDKGELLCILGDSGSVFLDGVCHPRPGGGSAAVGQDGHYGAGASGAVRPAGGDLPQPGNPLRWGISQPVQPALGSRWHAGKNYQAGLTDTGSDSAQAINDRRWLWKSSHRRFCVWGFCAYREILSGNQTMSAIGYRRTDRLPVTWNLTAPLPIRKKYGIL